MIGTGSKARSGMAASRFGWPPRRMGLASVALALALAWSNPGLGASGEDGNTFGLLQAQNNSCTQLRSLGQVSNADIIFYCNANRDFSDGRKECDVTSLSTLVRGRAYGFCSDTIPSVSLTEPNAALEAAVGLTDTAYFVNTGIVRQPNSAPVDIDVVCATFPPTSQVTGSKAAPGVRACRQIIKCPNSGCPSAWTAPTCNDDGAGKSYIKTYDYKSANPLAYSLIKQQISTTVTGNQEPALSHALFYPGKSKTNPPAPIFKQGSMALWVFPGFIWGCGDASSADSNVGSSLVYDFDWTLYNSPACQTGYRAIKLVGGTYTCVRI